MAMDNEDRGDNFVPTEDDIDTDTNVDTGNDVDKDVKVDVDKDIKADADKDIKADADKEGKDKGDKEKPKDTRVPLSRHKEILDRERAAREEAEKKLAQYEQGNRVAIINDDIKKGEEQIAKLDDEYASLIADGKTKEAAAKMREIRALEREVSEAKVELRTQAATSQAIEKVRYDTVVERLETAYPVLNPESDEHDAEATQDVLDLAATYRARGLTPSDAIQKAAKKLLGAETTRQKSATEVTPRVDKDDAEKVRKETEEKRRREQVDKNLKTDKQQPADTSKVGADSDKAGGGLRAKDVIKMSDKDFNALDPETMARLRGDVL